MGTVDDELLVTSRCVIWSRGGIFRKCYKFDLEKEPVMQALLTTFPSVGPLAKAGKDVTSATRGVDTRSTALVVFLKTQAHVYFLAGASHVIHLPFEVESACAAPNGLIIQRKLRVDNIVPASLKFPRVPPNSFVSSQPQPWSAASSQLSTFSIADLGAPKQMPTHNSTLKDLWEPPTLRNDANWPRLFSLTDPMSEIGLVVAQPSTLDSKKSRRSSTKLSSLETAEEIIHISKKSDFPFKDNGSALCLALTWNRETTAYTVWKLSYTTGEIYKRQKQRVPSGATSRRRSSFMPGTGTGATTPVMSSHPTFRESLGPNPVPLLNKKVRQDEARDRVVDFVSSLDPDYEGDAVPRRKSRRVSSMLARSDLSANHERSAFSELATGNPTSRRAESMNLKHGRTSLGSFHGANTYSQPPAFNQSVNSYLEAPVDDLLDELRAGGDFEGFHSMGLEDDEFDALRQEVILTKICTIPAEQTTIRYSFQNTSAKTHSKVFSLTAPVSASDDQNDNSIIMCVLDSNEQKLLLLTLSAKTHRIAKDNKNRSLASFDDDEITVVSLVSVMRAKSVIDACRLDDGVVSRVLVLTETPDGYGELSLQAPWSTLMKVPLPAKFAVNNIRSLSHDSQPAPRRQGGMKRVLSHGPRSLKSLQHSRAHGGVDLVDEDGRHHDLQIHLEPRNPHVKQILEVCRAVLPGRQNGEGVLVAWWHVMQWFRLDSINVADVEWSALAVTLFSAVVSFNNLPKRAYKPAHTKRKSRSGVLRSSTGTQGDLENWDDMMKQESGNGNVLPSWSDNPAWRWIMEESPGAVDVSSRTAQDSSSLTPTFLERHVRLAREFAATSFGSEAIKTCLPCCGDRPVDFRKSALSDMLVGIHIWSEEQKLNTTSADSFTNGSSALTVVMAQIFSWLNWHTWVESHELEEASLIDLKYDKGKSTGPLYGYRLTLSLDSALQSIVPEPFDCPSVIDWIQACFITQQLTSYIGLPDLVASRTPRLKHLINHSLWTLLTPRTLLFQRFFSLMSKDWAITEFVEALSEVGVDTHFLESLPEAILAPLREALAQCQSRPPTSWSKQLLSLISRDDLNTVLVPASRHDNHHASLLAPSHESAQDVHAVCASAELAEGIGSFDGSAEIERQAITRAIFKEDRRVNEAMNILNTTRPRVARVAVKPGSTESEILEAQKEHAQMLAHRTLAISSGRGLIYFSARIPLLTQKFSISGFNLSCIMKPDNNTVGIDKSAFTEDKVCWAFFHSGVAAGLSISRDAKGIDTSWILYNKPAQELSHRHAGFLLALGLNGHLKSVAKWVAFKYLTPKHTMTSIGLLLGLAASYIGTMDSLVTRLLSVHVTRMLPQGAAELNLSPLTQTTGIMGIGLLYCNTQHRRMSEIMVSEIEHIDTETETEPLRNEGYRLAAGFALGFINLGKGSDLRGLHDMRLTERLLALAAGSRKVDLVHVLDKSTAGAVVAISLIFMKSENATLARKIDVPESPLQFDYVRPDIFLLRTLARHLIMWSHVTPSFQWMKAQLPQSYQKRSLLTMVKSLTSDDLPFFNIVAGICFSIALKYAGSGNTKARDMLLHYLDQLVRICRIPAGTFDEKLARNTVRNCQDLLGLSAATVMAGTGDLDVFRRLRSMHGRDDGDTPYGSHLAAHLAIGALFLGGGTFTFGTSNLAVASLIVAFYPLFPSSVHDNKSHLQAFRHFWALAAEPRCLIARDIDTGQPISIPVAIHLRSGEEVERQTPTLVPELHNIRTMITNSPEHWNLVLDFENNAEHLAAFKSNQTIYVRRRPALDSGTSPFQATLHALDDTNATIPHPLEWVFTLPAFETLTKAERALVLSHDHGGPSDLHAGTAETVVDSKLVLEHASIESGKRERLKGLRMLFMWADDMAREGKEIIWIRMEVVQRLKGRVWLLGQE